MEQLEAMNINQKEIQLVYKMMLRPVSEPIGFPLLLIWSILIQEAKKIVWIWAFCWFVDFSSFVLLHDYQVTITTMQWKT